MSSRNVRPPLRGVIYQGSTIVGGVVLNAPDEPFVREFNREYGKLGLRVASQGASSRSSAAESEQPVAQEPRGSDDSGPK